MLRLHTSGDLRTLAAGLADVLADAPADPMEPDLVAVPSAGMRMWLALELAGSLGSSGGADGVSANIEFPFPGALRQRVLDADPALRAGSGANTLEGPHGRGHWSMDADPWSIDRLVWRILEAVDAAPQARATPSLLVSPPEGSSRYAAARRVADLYDRYHLHRPEMVRRWAAGDDVDGIGSTLPTEHVWQPTLWRSVRRSLGVASPPERLAVLLDSVRSGEVRPDLPRRVCVFGMSLLPGGAGFLELADALAATHDIHLFVVEPTSVLRQRFAARGGAPDGSGLGHRRRKEVDASRDLSNPLLRSWGRMHYETAAVLHDAAALGMVELGEMSAVAAHRPPAGPAVAASAPDGDPGSGAPTLLSMLQEEIRSDAASSGVVGPGHAALPGSGGHTRHVEFHACHGPARQVEVMRDTILRLLCDHPHLGEDDVLVVCPALEQFAPIIEATLGPSAPTGSSIGSSEAVPALRYRLADRSLGSSSQLVGAFTALLDLVAGRFDAPGVLDILALDPVARRLGLDEDDLATITEWVIGTGIRWGLDEDHRLRHGVATTPANTWRAGVESVLLGSAVRSEALGAPDLVVDTVGGSMPTPAEGAEVAVAGRLADTLWRLEELAARSSERRTVGGWIELLEGAAHDFLGVDRDQAWQLERLLEALGSIEDSASVPGTDPGPVAASGAELDFTDVRRLVADRLGGIEGRPSFMRGGVTISSLTPLRWVPHQVVVMLGMDAHNLSVRGVDGDDLAAAEPLLGDRDPRGEMRQAMLETLLAARQHLVVIRDGHDVRTNQPVPMAVPVAELRDAVVGLVEGDLRGEVLRALEVHHPRQPFDERYFAADGGPSDGGPAPDRSFDGRAALAAGARRHRRPRVGSYLEEPLAPLPFEQVDLADLKRFLRAPVRFFLERRLELRLPRDSDVPSGVVAAHLDALEQWNLGESLLIRLLEQPDADRDGVVGAWSEELRRAGRVPPGVLGERELRKARAQALGLAEEVVACGVRGNRVAEAVQVDLPVAGGDAPATRLVGSVELRLGPAGDDGRGGPAVVSFSRRKPSHLWGAWVDLAALALARPEQAWRTAVCTRAESGTQKLDGFSVPKFDVGTYELEPDDPLAAAHETLATVVDLYRRGLREPLPMFRSASSKLLRRDLSPSEWPGRTPDTAEMVAFGHLSARELGEIPCRPDDPPGSGDDRARRYANHVDSAVRRLLVGVDR